MEAYDVAAPSTKAYVVNVQSVGSLLKISPKTFHNAQVLAHVDADMHVFDRVGAESHSPSAKYDAVERDVRVNRLEGRNYYHTQSTVNEITPLAYRCARF